MTFAVDVSDYRELAKAIRDRITQLGISLETAEELAGVPSGYLSKMTGERPLRRASPYTLLLVLQALSLKVTLTHDAAMAERMTKRYRQKNPRMVRPPVCELSN
jgi:hypothetical protein